jgi:hypothetical protein
MYGVTFVNGHAAAGLCGVPNSGQNALACWSIYELTTASPRSPTSGCLHDLGWTHIELRAENSVPEAASNAEAILVVSEVMLEMVLLELLVVGRKSEDVS